MLKPIYQLHNKEAKNPKILLISIFFYLFWTLSKTPAIFLKNGESLV